jgi:hypothetical protein
MKPTRIPLLALSIVFALTTRGAVADEPGPSAKLQDKIIGTWKLVSAKYSGQAVNFPEGSTMLKHITPSQFMWATYDKDGKVFRAAGGSYTLKGEEYVEAPEYGIGQDFELIKGKTHTFQCRIDGNTWHHDGKLSDGQTIEEVWERVEKK